MTNTVLAPLPVTREFDDAGTPLAGGQLFTYQARSFTPLATYQDLGGTIQNTNPIVLDTTGRALVRYQAGQAYKLVMQDKNGNVLWTEDDYLPPPSDSQTIGQIIYPQSTDESSASVTPVNYYYPVGDIRRYGAVLNSSTDDTAAFQNWAKVPGYHRFPVAQTGLISAAITLVSNSTYEFTKGAVVSCATHDINMFQATGASEITIRGAHFLLTSAGTAPYSSGVSLTNCNDCIVSECEFEGMQFAGIMGSAVNRCTFQSNYCHDCLGSMASSADIYVESSASASSSYNVIDGNFCNGPTLEFGIAVWDPYAGFLPLYNTVTNNHVKAHNGYGILIYMPDAGDSYNQIIGNYVQDISAFAGSPANPDSGAGIYVVGAGAGGTQVIGNVVRNCCITTSSASLAPAGIGISGTSSGAAPLVVSGNIVEGMTRYHGILLTGVLSNASVTGNTVRMPSQPVDIGDGIRIVNGNNVSVTGNTVSLLTTTTSGDGISLVAKGASCTNVSVVGNTVSGGHSTQLRCSQVGGNQVQNVVFSGNICTGGDNTNVPLMLDSTAAVNVMVNGNILRGGTATVVSQTACTDVRYSNNYLNGTGTVILTTSGACTGSHYDRSNFGTGTGAGVVNGATGFTVIQSGSAAPAAGTWAVGDTIMNTAPSAAGVFLWVTTTAGAGTWKVISNS